MVGIMKKEILIKGMHCKSCELIIKEELSSLNSVKCISIDFKTGKLNLEFDDSKISMSEIKDVINREGYLVE